MCKGEAEVADEAKDDYCQEDYENRHHFKSDLEEKRIELATQKYHH